MSTCKNCLHHSVCDEINSLKCRDQFIWYDAEHGCPHYEPKHLFAFKIFSDIESHMIEIKTDFSTIKAIGKNAFEYIKIKYTEGK